MSLGAVAAFGLGVGPSFWAELGVPGWGGVALDMVVAGGDAFAAGFAFATAPLTGAVCCVVAVLGEVEVVTAGGAGVCTLIEAGAPQAPQNFLVMESSAPHFSQYAIW